MGGALMREEYKHEKEERARREQYEEERRELALDILALVARAERKSLELERLCTSYDQIALVAFVGVNLGSMRERLETLARYNRAREREIEALR